MTPLRICVVSAVAGLLGGCTAVRHPLPVLPAEPPPAQWSVPAADAPPALGQWWRRFRDPVMVSLMDRALAANTTIAGARVALQQARALRDQAAAALRPGLTVSATSQHAIHSPNPGDSYDAAIDATWEPDVFGARRVALQASDADSEASMLTLADVQVSTAAEVALAYIQLRGAQMRLQVARDNLASQEETLRITSWRTQAGLLTSLEEEQARAAWEQSAARVPVLESSVAQLRHSLAVLCAMAPAALDAELAGVAPVPADGESVMPAVPAETLRRRPDVRVAEYKVIAAHARAVQADIQSMPTFRLEGTIGLHGLGLGGSGGSSLLSALLGNVTGVVADGGANRAQFVAQSAALAQAQLAYRATVLAALREVEDALSALAGNRERLQRLRLAEEAASNAALLARQRYASGLVDFQVVLDTQRTLFANDDDIAITSIDLGMDQVRLYKALGGGWEAP